MTSDVQIKDSGDVVAECCSVDPGHIAPLLQEGCRAQPGSRERGELRYWFAIAGDGHGFASFHAIKNLATGIAQVSHGHVMHVGSVSPVIHLFGEYLKYDY